LRIAAVHFGTETVNRITMKDSDVVTCNGDRISDLRRECGLTQEDFAIAAGYSVRLVRKAEKNGAIRFSTLTALATALQRQGMKISAADLCSDPVQIVQAFVEAYRIHEQQMMPQIRHLLSDDLSIFIAGDPEIIPFAGEYHGPDGLQDFWDRFFGLIERPDKNALDLQYFVCGSEVVAYGMEQGRIRRTQKGTLKNTKGDIVL